MKNVIRILLLVVLLAVGVWLWKTFFPGDEVVIRRQLTALAEAASFGANEGTLAKVANAARVAGHFTSDAEIDIEPWGYQRVVIQGRQELQQAAVGARSFVSTLQVEVENIVVTLNPDHDSAAVRLTLAGSSSRNPERQSQEMELQLLKLEGDWLIHRARTFEYLRP